MDENAQVNCLNCGNSFRGNYCPQCGQKVQSLRLSVKHLVAEALETLFDIDNRFFKTILDLFIRPWELTHAYLQGKRVRYISPLKIYFSASVLYFLLISLVDTQTFMFITLKGVADGFENFLQNLMIVLVPVFAAIVQFLHRKNSFSYAEHLVFTLHLFTIWFFFFGLFSFCEHLINNYALSGLQLFFITFISFIAKAAQVLYLVLFVKNIFKQGWLTSVGKTVAILFLYFIFLSIITFIYIKIFS